VPNHISLADEVAHRLTLSCNMAEIDPSLLTNLNDPQPWYNRKATIIGEKMVTMK